MVFSFILDINENVIQAYNNKNIKLLHQNLVNIVLESGLCISQAKKHYLVLKMTITGLKDCFPFIVFLDFYLRIDIDEIELGEISSLV